jgi:hypothetical protein
MVKKQITGQVLGDFDVVAGAALECDHGGPSFSIKFLSD